MFSRTTDISEEASTDCPLRPRSRPLLALGEMVVLLIALLIPACGGLYRADYYSRFVQGTCTITSGEVTSEQHHVKNGSDYTTYAPSFSYTVSAPGTSGVDSSGYDGPDHTSFYDEAEAQDIVNQYAVGTTTTCSYNPANPHEAFLVFQGYSQERAWSVFWRSLFLTGLAQMVTLLVWYLWVRKLMILHERGQLTRGHVVRHETRQSKNGRYTVSIIEYTGITILKRPIRGELTVSGHLSLKSPIPVCYDPYRPTRARRGDRPTQIHIRGAIIATLLLLASISGFTCLITFLLA
ncbi:hypothetical protein KSC_002110 [Ktedonobacter sp. SOSP1-52]|uniref:DUF3592 domain-containing protein n=1 Tax=Ktedonobacter sp. SOSP1-52 TaxID=2778366 RepID=UPI001915CF36|nr:DUF3592 domain-containing protein [Ktedonobacter sp. SOSP1-52]GHO61319.1 hypothetical protein KSC_002110 [Ktedonobacter sp. SOSP1-52]